VNVWIEPLPELGVTESTVGGTLMKFAVTVLGPFITIEEGLRDPLRLPLQLENVNPALAVAVS
jgi:hypothetical protein